MKGAYRRIEGLDRALEGETLPPAAGLTTATAIRLGLAVGLAIAKAINELTLAVDDVARELKSR